MFQFTQNFQTADRNKVNGADAGNAIYWSQSITSDTFTTTQYTAFSLVWSDLVSLVRIIVG